MERERNINIDRDKINIYKDNQINDTAIPMFI